MSYQEETKGLSQNQSHNKGPIVAIDGNEEVKVHLWGMMPSVTCFIRVVFQLLLFSQNARKHLASVETVCLTGYVVSL